MTEAEATLLDWLEHYAGHSPNAVALIEDNRELTFSDLHEKVLACAAGLRKLGVGQGTVVAVQLPNTEAFVVSLLAVGACRGIFQTLHMPYRQSELKQLLKHSGAKVVIAMSGNQDSGVSAIQSIASELPAMKAIVSVGAVVPGTVGFDELDGTRTGGVEDRPAPDDPFLLLYTSGTTASPKGVPHAYRGFLGNAHRSALELGVNSEDRLLSAAPMTHLYGLFVLHLGLATGASVLLMPAYAPKTFEGFLINARPSAVFAAPAHFAPLVSREDFPSIMQAATRLVCLSGAAVPEKLARTVDDALNTGSVIQLWGMTELQAGAFGRPGDPLHERLTTTGRATPKTELRVVDESGMPVAIGEEGELQVQGPSVFAGYLDNTIANVEGFSADGWFRTGDIASIDASGFVRLTGRSKEIINRGGVKFNPIDIEHIIAELPAIMNCAIVPYPDAVLGERACLCAELHPGHSLNLEEVQNALDKANVAKFKWPERIELIDALPLTPTRKVMRGELKMTIARAFAR